MGDDQAEMRRDDAAAPTGPLAQPSWGQAVAGAGDQQASAPPQWLPALPGADVPYASVPGDAPTITARRTVTPRGTTRSAAPPAVPRTVSRRSVLIGAGAGAMGLTTVGVGLGYVLAHRSTPGSTQANVFASDAAQVNHLLRRAGFGPTPNTIGAYLGLGVQGTIDALLNYTAVPDGLSFLNGMQFDFTKPADLIQWFLLRMLYSQRPLEEKMTLFWHGVLTSSFRKVGKRVDYLLTQDNTLRSLAMGRFDDLIHAISMDPAMLWWLDGRVNTGSSPNENYSRELMELFTLGIANPQGQPNYTQGDVHQGALALSGWAILDGKGVLVPRRHYNGTVSYLSHTGQLGLNDVVQILCAHPATPYHIAWRMWSFFAYATTPNDRVLQPLVDAYNQQNHSIQAMVRAMLTSPDFFGAKAYRARIKSPSEFVVSAVRGLGVEANGQVLPQSVAAMGQVLFDPPDVSGWDGDKDSSAWMSTQTWMARVNFINQLVAVATGGAAASTTRSSPSMSGASTGPVVQQTIASQRISSAQQLVDYYVAALVDNQLASDRRAMLLDALTQAPAGGATLALHGGAIASAAGVRQMLYLLMSMPEYQMN